MKPGKLEKITSGNYIAYTGHGGPKKCRIGKVLNVSKREASVLVHRHRPVVDGHMRVKWEPIFHEQGTEVVGSGSKASEEKVDVKNIIDLVQLHDGVLAHAAVRRLDHKKYTWNEDVVDVAGAIRVEPEKTDAADISYMLRQLHETPIAFPVASTKQLRDPYEASLFELAPVDFLEVLRGYGEVTIRVHESGLSVGEGIDRSAITYGRT